MGGRPLVAKWTWYRPWHLIEAASDGEGFFESDGITISAPESIQRVILRLGVAGYGLTNQGVLPSPWAGGVLDLVLTVDTDEEHYALLHTSIPMVVSTDRPDFTPPQVDMSRGHYSHPPVEWDFALRKAAPPPPASGIVIGWSLNFRPQPLQFPGQVLYPTNFHGSVDFQVLTSQPGI